MKRLIDANALKKELIGWETDPTDEEIELTIDKAPTVDAVEVVRCSKCRHWVKDDDVGYCENPDGLDNYARPNDFCSYGERKNNELGI